MRDVRHAVSAYQRNEKRRVQRCSTFGERELNRTRKRQKDLGGRIEPDDVHPFTPIYRPHRLSMLPAIRPPWFILLLAVLAKATLAVDSCQKLAVCALDKCMSDFSEFPSEDEMISHFLGSANFACVLGPTCFDTCNECDSCRYAQTQIKSAVLREKLGGECPLMERCAQTCLDDQVTDPFSCIFRSRCVKYCLDNEDCPQCRDIVKRIFTGFCYRNGFIEHYGRKCRPMFDELTKDFLHRTR